MKLHNGVTLYTNKSTIGFGKSSGMMVKRQGKFSSKAWPNYVRAGFKCSTPTRKEVNKKFVNGLLGNPIMNS